jgi:hypothetical protein
LRLFLSSLACVLLVETVGAQPAPEPSQTFSLPAFVTEVDRLIAGVESAGVTDAASLAATVPARWSVAAPDPMEVDTRWLVDGLADAAAHPEKWTTTREGLRRRLRAMRAHAAELADDSHSEVQQRARSAVQKILQRPEFQRSAASMWLERLQRRIGDWLADLRQRLGLSRSSSLRTAQALAWITALGAAAGLGVWLARTLARRPRGAALDLGAGYTARRKAREWALRALADVRAGNLKEAVRSAYKAAVLQLEEQGAWRVDESRTPREYLRILGKGDSRTPLMMDLTQRFEEIWYGDRVVSPDDTSRVTAHLEALGCLRPGERAM